MSLAEQLDAIRARAAKRVPEAQRIKKAEAINALLESGILEGAPKIGDQLPEFTLRNAEGEEVRSTDLSVRGPLILTFFRGTW